MAYPDPYPRPAPDPFIRRWLFITACIAALMLLWQFLPAIEAWFTPREAAERTVTARTVRGPAASMRTPSLASRSTRAAAVIPSQATSK